MSLASIDDDPKRLPGLFSAWDIGQLIEGGRSYVIEDGGRTAEGQPLFMVFRRAVAPGAGGKDLS